jgi:sugar lactone lactonase YvrE
MKLRALPLLSFASVLLLSLACGDAATEDVAEQKAANVTNDGGAAEEEASAGDAATRDAGNAVVAACAEIPSGPFEPRSIGQPFSGSEDFAFDGRGNIVGKRGDALVSVGARGSRSLATLPGQVYGLRYHPNGNLVAAIPGAGKLVTVAPDGRVTDFVTGLGTPNGVYVDFDGNTWVTEFGGNKVSKIAPDGTKTVVVSGAQNAHAANGVVLDAARKLLFYTEYAKGRIQRVRIDEPNAAPILVATIPGAALDGLVVDACGNVYAVDQRNSQLYRVRIDANGDAAATPELLASFPTNVANAQFGAGPGFDPHKLYVTGNPGTVYVVDLGVAGGPVPQPWMD